MTELSVAVVNGSPQVPSRSATLSELALAELREHFPVDAREVAPYRLGPGFTGAISREDADEATQDALRAVENADLLIVAIPVYRGSYPGMVKHFFDLIDQYALAAKPVLLMATGGSERHSLVIDQELRPLFGFFQAWVAPTGVYVPAASFDGADILDAAVYTRVHVAVNDLLPLLHASGA
jgi:FMN reductase